MARRDATVAAAVLLGATCALAGCGNRAGLAPQPAARVIAPPTMTPRLATAVPHTSPFSPSRDASVAAAIAPRRITLPHAEIGGHLGHRPNTLALEFAAKAGQVLEVRLDRDAGSEQGAFELEPAASVVASGEPSAAPGLAPIAVVVPDAATARAPRLRVLIADGGVAAPRYAELAAPEAGVSELFVRLPADGDYVVELEPPGVGLYRLALELRAPLPFPVAGYDHTAIKSFFGASRESGKRRHEGVDIFVPRRTPVVAVADGQVGLHVEGRGGIAVVLSIPGISYYYAHLERTAVGDGQRVRIGDVLGYVGSTGNAQGSDPHLHFGVYEFGKGAVDPMPLLEERRFARADDANEPLTEVAAALVAEVSEGASQEVEARVGGGGEPAGGGAGARTALIAAFADGCNGHGAGDAHGAASVATVIGEWAFRTEAGGLWEAQGVRCL